MNRRAWMGQLILMVAAGLSANGQSILNTNLVVNPGAEAGPAGTPTSVVTSIPGWTVTAGKPNVLPYGVATYEQLSDPGPPPTGSDARGFNYFAASGGALTTDSLTQVISPTFAVRLRIGAKAGAETP